MQQDNNEKGQQAKPDRKGYLKEYHKKRKADLGIQKVSLVLNKEEYKYIYDKAKSFTPGSSKRKNISLAPFIKHTLLSKNLEKNINLEEEQILKNFYSEKNEVLKELLKLVKNCTNNINQVAYALNLEKFYQQNNTERSKAEELKILKDIYSKVSEMDVLISNSYYGIHEK